MAKRPPAGYRMTEFPLPHAFGGQFTLEGEDETLNSTYINLIRASEEAVDVENVNVNPGHAGFGKDTGPMIHMGSIVPRMQFTLHAHITKVGIVTDALRSLRFTWMPVYIAFLDMLEAEDTKTGVQVEDVLELLHDTTNKDVTPLYSTINLTGAQVIPTSTIPFTEVFGTYNLSANIVNESIAYDQNLLFDALQFNSNRGMLSKAIGKIHNVTLTRDRPYTFHSNNFTHPTVKRGNPYTYCGVLVHLHQGDSGFQTFDADEVTAIEHLKVSWSCRYDEWNPHFQQAPM